MHEHILKEVLVEITDLSLTYKAKPILNPISLKIHNIERPSTDIKQGQVIGILGPSGIGKSQFSHILAGLRKPTSGTVQVMDPVTKKMNPVKAGDMGYVFQNHPLFEHRTVLGNLLVAMEGDPLSKAEKKDKAMAALEQFGLKDKAGELPRKLSGGQHQRVAILQQILRGNCYIILDEPFTGLDPITTKKVCKLIHQVSTLKEETTLFVIAHNIEAVVAVCDQLWLFGKDSPDQGSYVKGYLNLIEDGLAWNPELMGTSIFYEYVKHVNTQFERLV